MTPSMGASKPVSSFAVTIRNFRGSSGSRNRSLIGLLASSVAVPVDQSFGSSLAVVITTVASPPRPAEAARDRVVVGDAQFAVEGDDLRLQPERCDLAR